MSGAAQTYATQLWRLNPLISLHWREWGDDDSVVFEARSGQLFQFDALSAALMACFEEQPRAVDEVTGLLAADLAATVDAEFHDTVAAIVQQFRRLGWLEPIMGG